MSCAVVPDCNSSCIEEALGVIPCVIRVFTCIGDVASYSGSVVGLENHDGEVKWPNVCLDTVSIIPCLADIGVTLVAEGTDWSGSEVVRTVGFRLS